MTAIKDPVCGMQAADDSHYHLEYAAKKKDMGLP